MWACVCVLANRRCVRAGVCVIGCICMWKFMKWVCGLCSIIKHSHTFTYPLVYISFPKILLCVCVCVCVCVVCVLLGSNSQRILNFFSQNLDNCHVFSMISLQFSIINIFLSFRGYVQFHSNSSEIWERKKERKRESMLWKIGVSQIHWDILMWLWIEISVGMFWRNLRDEIWKSLSF